jgi:hypothetical protein
MLSVQFFDRHVYENLWLMTGLFSCGKGGGGGKSDTKVTIMDHKGTTEGYIICMVILD